MTGPNVERSMADGELVGDALVGEALLGDARALTSGAPLGEATVGGNELATPLAGAVDAVAETRGALLATGAT